jgi:hypothetical protein
VILAECVAIQDGRFVANLFFGSLQKAGLTLRVLVGLCCIGRGIKQIEHSRENIKIKEIEKH